MGHDKSGEDQRASLIHAAAAREKTSRELGLQVENEIVSLNEGAESSQKENIIMGPLGWILIYSLK